MPITLALRGRHVDDERAHRGWDEVMRQLDEVDQVFSTYRPDSFVSRLGRGEIALEDCPAQVAEVMALADRAEERSGGAFNVRRAGVGGGTVLDTDGIVKGWAVQRASAVLRSLDGTSWCLSAGGDMVCHAADGRPWRIGIEDPHDPSRIVASVPMASGAVATSGSVHRGEHIVDARTGRVPDSVASVTVIADNLTWADIDATTAYALGPDAADWLAAQPGRSGLVLWRDGTTTRVTQGRRTVSR